MYRIGVALLALALVASGQERSKEPQKPADGRQQPTIGKEAPNIQGEDLDGRPMQLSDYRGKVVVLDFWGHW